MELLPLFDLYAAVVYCIDSEPLIGIIGPIADIQYSESRLPGEYNSS